MITSVVEWLTGITLILLVLVNRIGLNKTKKRRQNLCWDHNRKSVLGIHDSNNAKVDLIEKKESLRMHNNGTALVEENDRLVFCVLNNNYTELFWKRKD